MLKPIFLERNPSAERILDEEQQKASPESS